MTLPQSLVLALAVLAGHALPAHGADGLLAVWLGYNDPAFLAQRHGVASCPVVDNLRKALSGLAEAVLAR